jgi:hypothetical protein
MFFPQTLWWDSAKWAVPDSLKYLCERWWELLRDWRSITVYSLPCSYILSVLEDVADVIDDLQDGRLRSSHQLDSLRDELLESLRSGQLLRHAFPSEIDSTVQHFDALYDKLPADPQQRFAEIKKRRTECRRAASAARRLHHRCIKRRTSEPDMTWPGFGGLAASEMVREIQAANPNFGKIDRLTTLFIIDCIYRGYNLDYLTTLLDRYLPDAENLRDGLLHVFRRLHSLLRHEYHVLFALSGAASATIQPGGLNIVVHGVDQLGQFSLDNQEKATFLGQLRNGEGVVLGVNWSGAPDAGAAASAARNQLQEIVDFLDFHAPTQRFELAPLCIVTWNDNERKPYSRLHPDTSGEQPPHRGHDVEIDSDWSGQLGGLAEALRWSSVAQRERTPEVSLLAAWFGFEFLAGTLERTPVEGIMEFFPKTIAIGNLKRRIAYWMRSLQGSPGFESHARRDAVNQRCTFQRGGLSFEGTIGLLAEVVANPPSEDAKAVQEITSKSVLLQERTVAEAKLFTNNQLLAQTMQEDAKQIQRDLQGFLVIRNKLVHRARIDHPLLPVVSQRAKARLYDLLRDISGQLTVNRLNNSVGEVLQDYRDTFDELLVDLGQNKVDAKALAHRITLS